MTPAIRSLSVSAMQAYLRCPMLWYGRYIAKWTPRLLPASVRANQSIGLAIHAGIEAHHRGQDAGLALLQAWEGVRSEQPIIGSLERAIELLEEYRRHNPRDRRDRAEVKFSLDIEGLPVPFRGRLDVLRAPEIHDAKSGWSKWTQEKADAELQPAAYGLWYARTFAEPLEKFVYHILPTMFGQRTIQRIETRRTAEQIEAFSEQARCVYRAICTGEFRPACQPKKCQFPEGCEAWR